MVIRFKLTQASTTIRRQVVEISRSASVVPIVRTNPVRRVNSCARSLIPAASIAPSASVCMCTTPSSETYHVTPLRVEATCPITAVENSSACQCK
ncbi:hypothetical protein M404DRAFT_487835 [Pisolithus tinctorius Marx 270]|uniref:Uncharacterized protein n=1 Tax=Pisolithus tinctorius Marx 270 TaxID=870435 RepID=A0A0C3MXF2_PISTI|nr:hypothetical protein M404DRAFT_487835 [Pisolithus tinctorius Marx 270]